MTPRRHFRPLLPLQKPETSGLNSFLGQIWALQDSRQVVIILPRNFYDKIQGTRMNFLNLKLYCTVPYGPYVRCGSNRLLPTEVPTVVATYCTVDEYSLLYRSFISEAF